MVNLSIWKELMLIFDLLTFISKIKVKQNSEHQFLKN